MSINKAYILRLIQEEVDHYLLEQEEPAAPAPEPDAPEPAGDAGGDLDLDAGGDADLDLGGEGGDLDLGDAGAGGLEGAEGEEGFDDEGGDLGGGGGFGGGFGGGGGGFDFGDDGEAGLEADEEGEEDLLGVVGPEDVEIPDDPIMAITDDAISMLNQTRDPGSILKSVKSKMQQYFDDFDDATPIIKALWDTEDLVLRDVARRLLVFLKGE